MAIKKEFYPDGSFKGYTKRVIIDGVKRRVRATTKAEVETKVAKLKEQERRRRLSLPVEREPQPNITYGVICEKLLDGYEHREQSKRALRYSLRYSRDRFERVAIREIRVEHARRWFASLTVAPTTERNALTAARKAFNFALEADYATENPFRQIQKPRATESKHPFESWNEVFAVAEALTRETERALVIFACATGLRPQEWRALQWCDIDRASGVLRVSRTIQNGKTTEAQAKTPGAPRAVELIDRALAALDLLPMPLRRERLVFPGTSGGILDTHAWSLRGRRIGPWVKALEAVGLDYREPRQMRHTFATLALTDGASIEWIAKQMGHKDIATTLGHYRRWLPSDRSVDALNATHAKQTGPKADPGTAVAEKS